LQNDRKPHIENQVTDQDLIEYGEEIPPPDTNRRDIHSLAAEALTSRLFSG
jgi:hypothetical protein